MTLDTVVVYSLCLATILWRRAPLLAEWNQVFRLGPATFVWLACHILEDDARRKEVPTLAVVFPDMCMEWFQHVIVVYGIALLGPSLPLLYNPLKRKDVSQTI